MIESKAFEALQNYAKQSNLFLDFVRNQYPEVSEIESIQIATTTLKKLMQLLAQSKPGGLTASEFSKTDN